MMVHVGLVNVIAGLSIVSLSSIGLGCCITSLWMLWKPKKPKGKYEYEDMRPDEPKGGSHD